MSAKWLDEDPPFERDDIRTLIDETHPGGWEAYRQERKEEMLTEARLDAQDPRRRLTKRIQSLARETGIDVDTARRLIEERLANELAEIVIGEFRETGGSAGRSMRKEWAGDKAQSIETAEESRIPTPYLDVKEAARYLRKTPKAIYGLIERGKLKKMPGSRVCLFTREMLDDFLRGEAANGRGVRPGRRKKG